MVIHPPVVFLYYSFCIAISSVVIATMFDAKAEPDQLRHRLVPLARPALLVGTLGVGLGGLWAYTVLDWGGYWAWDPVETASLLPWLSLVILLHLPQRPGKLAAKWWMLAGLMPGLLAILSTLVTRANGVWFSRHAFVGDGSGSTPPDVWGRLMLIRGDVDVGVEVVGYLLVILLCLSTWVAWLVRQELRSKDESHALGWNWGLPWLLIPGSAIFVLILSPFDEQKVAEMVWGGVSGLFLAIVGFSPLLSLVKLRSEILNRLKRPANLLILIGTIAACLLSGDLIIGGLAFLLILPLVVQARPEGDAGMLAAPILFWIFAAWSQLIEIPAAAVGMVAILLPWLMISEDDHSPLASNNVQRLALMVPSTIGATFLLLTWMLLIASIDAPRFESHELLGSVLISLLVIGMTVFGWRRTVEQRKQVLLVIAVLLSSLLMAVFIPETLPGDSSDILSGVITRGHVAWLLILPLLMALPAMSREAALATKSLYSRLQKRGRTGSSNRWRSMGAHMVHVGLLLLLLGHVFTTTLIDRGDASHRLSLVKDQAFIVGDEAYIFREVVIISEDDPEFEQRFIVGDGYIGVRIDVHEVEDGKVGSKIVTVEPGVLRFDSPNGRTTARSEVASHARFHGDLILIFDSSQAGGLMTASLFGGLDEVDSVRVTIYDLNGSHLVWIGWAIMLLGLMFGVGTWRDGKHPEEEE